MGWMTKGSKSGDKMVPETDSGWTPRRSTSLITLNPSITSNQLEQLKTPIEMTTVGRIQADFLNLAKVAKMLWIQTCTEHFIKNLQPYSPRKVTQERRIRRSLQNQRPIYMVKNILKPRSTSINKSTKQCWWMKHNLVKNQKLDQWQALLHTIYIRQRVFKQCKVEAQAWLPNTRMRLNDSKWGDLCSLWAQLVAAAYHRKVFNTDLIN